MFKHDAGVATEGDVAKLKKRMDVLGNYMINSKEGTWTEFGRLLTVKKHLCKRIDIIMADVKRHAVTMEDSLNVVLHLSDGLSCELHWVEIYMVKSIRSFHYSNNVMDELDDLIQGLTSLETGVLSPLIVPTATLQPIMTYIEGHL